MITLKRAQINDGVTHEQRVAIRRALDEGWRPSDGSPNITSIDFKGAMDFLIVNFPEEYEIEA